MSVCVFMGLTLSTLANTASEEADIALNTDMVFAAPGQTVNLPIIIQSNSGFQYLRIRVEYDAQVLTHNFNDTVSNSFEMTSAAGLVMAAGENKATGSDSMTGKSLISWDSASDYTGTDTIGILSFTVSEEADFGTYPVKITCEECYDSEKTEKTVSTVDTEIVVRGATSTITNADMVLESDISVNYYAQLDESHVGAQMRFTMNGKVTLVDGVATGVDGEYVYTFKGLAPQCMGDNIKAELVLGGVVLDAREEYSVLTYCQNMLSKTAAELGLSDEKYAALRTLIADMLEYGARAQLYRGYKTDALVNEGITGQREFAELGVEYEKYIDESGYDGVEMIAAGVYFDYTNSLYIKFTAPGMTDDTFYVVAYNTETREKVEYALSDCTLISEETSTYLLVLDPCAPSEYDDLYYIDIYAPNSRGRIDIQQTLEYRIAAYTHSMQNKTDGSGELTPMAQLTRATYNYGLSAAEYAAIAE